MTQLSLMHMHAAELCATRKRGDTLARVEQRMLVERTLDAEEPFEDDRWELRAHAAELLDADTMLAGDRPADVDAQLQDAITELDRAVLVAGLVRVEQDQRMQVAVAGVEDVRARQAELTRPVLDLPQHARQRCPRNRAVDAVVIRRNAANGRKGRLATRPVQQTLGLVLRHANLGRAARLQHIGYLGH